jgi:hypothetical protein
MSKECVTHHYACDCREENFKKALAACVEYRAKLDKLEAENAALRSAVDQQANYHRELRADRDRLDWLEQFLQIGRASVFSSPTCEAHKDRPDDTEKTRWNHPFHIGYDVELEHRGCYKWQELSNGAKGIRPAIDAARKEKQP